LSLVDQWWIRKSKRGWRTWRKDDFRSLFFVFVKEKWKNKILKGVAVAGSPTGGSTTGVDGNELQNNWHSINILQLIDQSLQGSTRNYHNFTIFFVYIVIFSKIFYSDAFFVCYEVIKVIVIFQIYNTWHIWMILLLKFRPTAIVISYICRYINR
jgi:hypothetical protein